MGRVPDRWTLKTPSGDYELNASFAARQYHPGGVDTAAALRRDDRTAYQRSGDGLRTPGPLVLYGVVARDDQDVAAIVDELNDIRDAVAACTQVIRTTSAGTYTYDGLSGGPTPEVTPDGLGGWRVVIELWPQRAAATFVPSSGPVDLLAAGVEFFSFASGSRTLNVAVPGGEAPVGSLVIFAFWGKGTIDGLPDGFVNLNGLGDLSWLGEQTGMRAWAFRLPVTGAPLSSIDVDCTGTYGIAHTLVLAGQGMQVADIKYALGENVPIGASFGVEGEASTSGLQVFIGDLTNFGVV